MNSKEGLRGRGSCWESSRERLTERHLWIERANFEDKEAPYRIDIPLRTNIIEVYEAQEKQKIQQLQH